MRRWVYSLPVSKIPEVLKMKLTGKPVYHFVIPYPWKRFLRGVDAIGIGTIMIYTIVYLYLIFKHGKAAINPAEDIFIYSVLFLVYFIMRYIPVKYDKIKSPIEITITDTMWQYKKGELIYNKSFTPVKNIRVTLDDKQLEMWTDLEEADEDGDIAWRFAFRRKDELGELDYREFTEKTYIPAAKYMIKRIKELNPDVKVTWEDRRKKYR